MGGSGLQERQEVGVKEILVGCCQSVGSARVDLQNRAFDDFRGQSPGVINRHDLVSITVHDQCRHIEFLQIFVEVRFRELFDAIISGVKAHQHALCPECIPDARETLEPGRLAP
jgi:hypothetical protein